MNLPHLFDFVAARRSGFRPWFGCVVLFLAIGTARSEQLYLLGSQQGLTTVDSASPNTPLANTTITGTGTERIVSIDTRQATGELFGYSDGNKVYRINPITGVATLVGSQSAVAVSGLAFGFDIHPSGSYARLSIDPNQSVRFDLASGISSTLPTFQFVSASNGTPRLPMVSFDENGTLYGLEVTHWNLVRESPALSGSLVEVGFLNHFPAAGLAGNGFDISAATDVAYGLYDTLFGTPDGELFRIDLATGQSTRLESGFLFGYLDLAVVPEPSTWVIMAAAGLLCAIGRRRWKLQR